jgi:hypothetical protein
VRQFLVRLATSRTVKMLAAGAALISGLDDLIEAYFGIQDIFGLDVAHGIVFTALTGILDPLGKLIGEDKDRMIEKIGRQENVTRE